MLLLIVVGALTGLYGPQTATERSSSSWGELEVTHPRVVRAVGRRDDGLFVVLDTDALLAPVLGA